MPFLLLGTLVVALAAAGQEIDVTLHVSAEAGDDQGVGSAEAPLRTVSEAVARALENKRAFRATRILVQAGTYREGPISFEHSNYASNDPDNATPILVEAAAPGEAVISGSDRWVDWRPAGPGQFEHDWPYAWGVGPNPWEGSRELAEIARRRELVFVDREVQRQVLSRLDLEPGTFFVDEAAGLVYLAPNVGVDLEDALVEIGVRNRLWDQNWENNVTVRGLVFEHAATPWSPEDAAVWINASKDVVFEDCEVRWTNWQGIYIGGSERVSLRRVVLNHNGGQGWGMFRNRDVLVEDSETSFNNWRGEQAGFTGWAVGNKILSTHSLTVRGHTSVGNRSRGLWLDYDNEDVRIEGARVERNLRDGLWVEANRGPIEVESSHFQRNGGVGILGAFSENVTLSGNVIAHNEDGQIRLAGTGTRPVSRFDTGEQYGASLTGWVLTGNRIEGRIVFQTASDFRGRDWRRFVKSLESDGNEWKTGEGFRVLGRRWNLWSWRWQTGQDKNSTG